MKSKKKITLEDYLDFCKNQQEPTLTHNFINQIISIHGFVKDQNASKTVLLEHLRSINPMESQRSTLKENISSSAILPLTEVKEDLAYLDWNECPIQSILAVETKLLESDLQTNQASSTCVAVVGKVEKLKRKRKRRTLAELSKAKSETPACLPLLTSAEVTPPSSCLSLGSG